MNRNKRRLTKANHGAKPNNSINRKSKGINGPHGSGWRGVGMVPNQIFPISRKPGTPNSTATVKLI